MPGTILASGLTAGAAIIIDGYRCTVDRIHAGKRGKVTFCARRRDGIGVVTVDDTHRFDLA